MMKLEKNIIPGKNNLLLIFSIFSIFFLFFSISKSETIAKDTNKGKFVEIKILDKISSKNTLLKLKNGELKKFKDLEIKSHKCKNSEFDDNPEVTAYLQVKDLSSINNDEVFVFNGWTFSSSPGVKPFDHPVYDIWLTKCY